MKEEHSGKEESKRILYEELEAYAREKIREHLQDLLEQEVTEWLGRGKGERKGNALEQPWYRNGYGKVRRFTLSLGTVEIRRPRVRNLDERFQSRTLPLFKRQTKQVRDLIPELYLHGLASGDFELALRGLLGEGAPLSKASIGRLKSKWQIEYEEWKRQDLSGLKIVYQWTDGIFVKAGLEKEKAALLVVIGVLTTGEKVLLACESGYRESKESWLGILRNIKRRGLCFAQLTMADGHLGIWSALGEIHPEGDGQRCWNHKITNVLDAMPKRVRNEAFA